MAGTRLREAGFVSLALVVLVTGCGEGASPTATGSQGSPLSTPHVTTPPPRGTSIPGLTAQDEDRIREIGLGDARLQDILDGRDYERGDVFPWHTSKLQKLGGSFVITFPEPFSYEGAWPADDYDDTESVWPPLQTFTVHFRAGDIGELRVMVDLVRGVVAEAWPDGARISNYTPPRNITPFPTSATPRSD